MLTVLYTSRFVRVMKRLDPQLIEEALEKIELFKDPNNHQLLKVHKLKGRLVGRSSFSVNYKFRIVFHWLSSKQVILLSIGSHAVYDE